MKTISLLSPTISGNALSRVHCLAKMLQHNYNVVVVCPGTKDNIWPPLLNDKTIEYREFQKESIIDLYKYGRSEILELIEGDLIYAVKPLIYSYGLGLLVKSRRNIPLLLDIDDWEVGFLLDRWHWDLQRGVIKWFKDINSPFYTRFLDKLTWAAGGITVSNSFLQNKYGGCWIPHARDEKLFDSVEKSKPDKSLNVLFLGTPRTHKGLDILLAAWRSIKNKNAILRIMGIPKNSFMNDLQSDFDDERIIFEGPYPYEETPKLAQSASVIVIPQANARASLGQLPAKLIDAMAAGVPIISTSVGDIPLWLSDGAGVVVAPGDVEALSRAIDNLLDDDIQRKTLGRKAKERFMQFGSFEVIQPKLFSIVEAMLAGDKPDNLCTGKVKDIFNVFS